MARGGKRPGAGRKAGSKNRPKLELTAEEIARPNVRTPAARMRKQRDLVASLVAQDMPREAIAVNMGISVERLEALFATELEYGHAIVKAKLTAALLPGVDDGRVAAIRALDAMVGATPATPRQSRAGKKQQAVDGARARVAAGGIFAPMAPPSGVGKKDAAIFEAQNPDTTSSLGRLLAQRQGLPPGIGKKEWQKLQSEGADEGTQWEGIFDEAEPKGPLQ